MPWKQPIPTNLNQLFGEDHLIDLLYRELIYRSANKDGEFYDKITNKTVSLKRGQVIFGRKRYHEYLARETKDEGKKVERVLHRLGERYKLITLDITHRHYTIVTLIDYDELVGFDQPLNPQTTHQSPSSNLPMTTSKNDKNIKNEEKIINPDQAKNLTENIRHRYPFLRKNNTNTL